MEVAGVKRPVTLSATSFSRSEFAEQAARDHVSVERLLSLAVLYFVSDLGKGRAAAKLPPFKPHSGQDGSESLQATLELDKRTWSAVADHARREGVPVERMVEHAAFYYLADAHSGRLTRRLANGRGRSSRSRSRAQSRAR